MINNFKKGLTLIELMVVVAIISIILYLTLPSVTSFRETQTLKNTTESVVNWINDARVATLSSQSNSAYGVHFDEYSVVLFMGSTYNSSASSNKTLNLDSLVRIDPAKISLYGSGNDMVFQRLTGETANYGTIVLELIDDPTTSRTISVNGLGVVSVN